MLKLSVCLQVNGKTVFWKCWKLSLKNFILLNSKLGGGQDDFSGFSIMAQCVYINCKSALTSLVLMLSNIQKILEYYSLATIFSKNGIHFYILRNVFFIIAPGRINFDCPLQVAKLRPLP